jgi:hypothetical protein
MADSIRAMFFGQRERPVRGTATKVPADNG